MDDKKQLPIPSEIRSYLEGLLEEASVPLVEEKAKEELLQYLFERLDKYLSAKIVENMPAADTEKLIQMNEEGKSQEEISQFMKEHMENPQEVFTHAFIDFRDFYLTGQNITPQN